MTRTGLTDLAVLHVDSESDLLEEVIRLVTTWDPDMLVGYEVRQGGVALCSIHSLLNCDRNACKVYLYRHLLEGNYSVCVCMYGIMT